VCTVVKTEILELCVNSIRFTFLLLCVYILLHVLSNFVISGRLCKFPCVRVSVMWAILVVDALFLLLLGAGCGDQEAVSVTRRSVVPTGFVTNVVQQSSGRCQDGVSSFPQSMNC
jgi:hypothetical protein